MENALLVGLSRQMALMHELDVVANNIANINTTGYKTDNALFERISDAARQRPDLHRPRPPYRLRPRPRYWIDMSPGAVERTGNPLDVAIEGNAYPGGPERARPAPLYAQRRAVDQCRGTARHHDRRSGDRQRRADNVPVDGSRHRHQRRRHYQRAAGQQHRRLTARHASLVNVDQPQRMEKDGGADFTAPDGVNATRRPPAPVSCRAPSRSRTSTAFSKWRA